MKITRMTPAGAVRGERGTGTGDDVNTRERGATLTIIHTDLHLSLSVFIQRLAPSFREDWDQFPVLIHRNEGRVGEREVQVQTAFLEAAFRSPV